MGVWPLASPPVPYQGYHTATVPQPRVPLASNGMPTGRASWDTSLQLFGPNTSIVMPPEEAVESWRILDLDAATLRNISATRLLQVLSDASPDVSRALYDAHTMINPGWEATAYRLDSPRLGHKKGQLAVDKFFDMLGRMHGAPSTLR